MTAPGWYNAAGDPPGTQRYWDGNAWVGDPVAVPAAVPAAGAPLTANRAGRPAGAGNRMLARVIDLLIVLVFIFALILLDLGGSADSLVVENSDLQLNINGKALDTSLEYGIYVVFLFAWTVGWIHLKGGTPGKLMLKMRVSDATTGQVPVDLKQACLRTANYVLPILGIVSLDAGDIASTVLFVIGLVSLIMLFVDSQHRTVMDRIAKTVVVQV